MYCFAKQIHPTTVVEHSIYCNFYNDKERNLVIGGGNQIKVFNLVLDSNNNDYIDLNNLSDVSVNKKKVKLECIQSFNFFGEVSSIDFVRLNKNVRDSLLITFMDAKLSIVEYDPNVHSLKTLSMNYFEDDDMKQGYVKNIYQPLVRSDPDGRCAAMFNYGRNIVVFPFKTEATAEEHSEQNLTANDSKSSSKINSFSYIHPLFKNTLLPAYKLDLREQNFPGEKINNIIDIQFLEGYNEPILLILYEPIRTWSGRIAVRQDTCSMIALSLNVHQKVHPIIWSTNNLPFDSLYAVPVPRPIGGVLIFCTNILIYLNQSVPPYAVSLNTFAEASSSFPMIPQKNIKISLDCSKACFLSNDKLVISLKGGEIYVVTLFIDRMRSVKKFHFEKAASSVISSCLTFCGKEFLFLGSRLGNSLLLKCTEKIINIQPRLIEETNNKLLSNYSNKENKFINEENEELKEDVPNNILPKKKEITPFIYDENDESEETDLYGEENLMDSETTITNCIKRKLEEEIEFDDEDKELYGDTDPIFNNNEINLNNNQEEIIKNNDNQIEDNCLENNNKFEELNEKNEEERILNDLLNNEDDLTNNLENGCDLINEIGNQEHLYLDNLYENKINNLSDFQVENSELNGLGNWMAGDVALMKDSEELEIFGPEENEDKLPITLQFEVCDSIINIGPCSRFCMGELSFLAEELEKESDPQIEIVTTSGFGKNGALCVLQRSIRPQIVTTFNLPNCIDMWTVYSLQKDLDFQPTAKHDYKHHAFLILSKLDSTIILQTGQEINELDQNGFINQSRTIFAGNLYNNKYIIQISLNAIRLIEGTKQVKNFPLDLGSPIVSASLADPHCVVMTENGILIHLHLSFESNAPKLTLVKLEFSENKSKIISCTLHKDVNGLFVTKLNNQEDKKLDLDELKSKINNSIINSNGKEIVDLDELLYGDSDVTAIVGASLKTEKKINTQEEEKTSNQANLINIETCIKIKKECMPTYWLFVNREDGCLEIYSIPDINLVYLIEDFAICPKTLTDCDSSNRKQINTNKILDVHEIFIGNFGIKNSRTLLFVRFKDEVCVYEVFKYIEKDIESHLKIRFCKLDNSFILNESNQDNSIVKYKKYFRPFVDISGYNGLFVCGSLPRWFFMGNRSELRCHEMSIDGYITSFSPFHNVNCPKGFLYFNYKQDLRIAVLPTHITYDAPWPVRKVPTRCTVHFVKYHVENKCYVVVSSVLEEYNKVVKVGGDDKDYETLERDERYIWPSTERFSVQLFSPVSWEMIPGTRIDLDEWEHVTCLQNVMLQTEGTETGFKGYVTLGTNFCYGEDVTNKGRIWILDIVEVVPEPGQPLTKNKIKIVYNKEQKGPVTALTQVRGYLLSCIGQKMYIWQLKEDQLAGVAFIDTNIYIHSAVSIKNLILVADIYKSISLLRYQEETKTLALVSKDIRSFEVFACEFMVDNNLLCFIVSDADKNFILYNYQPEIKESNGGTRLLQRADYHLGSTVNHFFRIKCKKFFTNESNLNSTRQMTIFATLDGSLGYILPVSEKIYRRLLMVQNLMNNHLQHLAGLNPKAFRFYKTSSKLLLNPCKNILDGDLLFKFINLSNNEKYDLAKKIGTTTEQIRNDLFEIERITAHF